MSIKERGKSGLLERAPSQLRTLSGGLREGGNFLNNLNNLDEGDVEFSESSSQNDITSFLSPRERRLWDSLSETRKSLYDKSYAQKTADLAKEGAKATGKAAKGTAKAVKKGAEAAAKTAGKAMKGAAATTAKVTAATAGGAATGGILTGVIVAKEVVEFQKKIAKKFKNALQNRSGNQISEDKYLVASKDERKHLAEKKKENGGNSLPAIVCLIGGMIMTVIVTIILFLCLIFGWEEASMPTDIAFVAHEEYLETDYNIGGIKYKAWYGLDDDWCMMFVAWCANECGLIEAGVIPNTASVSEAAKWFQDKGLYYEAGSGYIPKSGDLVFFFGYDMSHVGIVHTYDASKDQLIIIDGNNGESDTEPYHDGSRVMKSTFLRGSSQIISGYATPKYP